jgi:hypothetical protein
MQAYTRRKKLYQNMQLLAISIFQIKNDPINQIESFNVHIMAERVGFEPTHALRRLADFESAPLGLLGTSPFVQQNVS